VQQIKLHSPKIAQFITKHYNLGNRTNMTQFPAGSLTMPEIGQWRHFRASISWARQPSLVRPSSNFRWCCYNTSPCVRSWLDANGCIIIGLNQLNYNKFDKWIFINPGNHQTKAFTHTISDTVFPGLINIIILSAVIIKVMIIIKLTIIVLSSKFRGEGF
jgi:hypothetical protein